MTSNIQSNIRLPNTQTIREEDEGVSQRTRKGARLQHDEKARRREGNE
jgi:hypothetical protein